MSSEHAEAFTIVARLSTLAEQRETWSPANFKEVRSLAISLVVILRHHIDKENNIFYPMAEANLPPEAWKEISQKFAAIEEERECAGQVNETRELVALLTR